MRLSLAAMAAVLGSSLLVSAAQAALLPITTITSPAASANAFSTTLAYGPDGRLYAYDGANVFKQTAINGQTFSQLSTSDAPVTYSDAGSIAFLNGGSTIVTGTGTGGFDFTGASAGIFQTTSGSGSGFTQLPNTVAGQYYFTAATGSGLANSNSLLAVDSGAYNALTNSYSSEVSYYSTSDGSNVNVITGITGASTTVGYDNAGHLYVGIGYGTGQGTVRRFNVIDLDNAYTSNHAVDFSTGTLLNSAENNSGTGYFVSTAGYLFVGGGSLGGFTVIAPDGTVKSFSQDGNYDSIIYNAGNDQFAVVTDTYDANYNEYTVAQVFDASSFIPEPTGLCAIGLALFAVLKRRRVA